MNARIRVVPTPSETAEPPLFVRDANGKRRWLLCVSLAMKLFDEPELSRDVQAAARALYASQIPTEEP